MTKWLAVAVLAVTAVGCGRGKSAERMEKMIELRVDDALDDLDATSDQRQQVQALTKSTITQAKPVIEQATAARSTLITEWKSNAPDSAKVHQTVDAQLDSIRAFAHVLADRAIDLHRLLKPEQRDQISARFDRFEKRHQR